MKRYEWYSELAPERVRARIQARSACREGGWRIRVQFKPWGCCLWMEPDIPPLRIRGQVPLRLRIDPCGCGCRLTGRFVDPRNLLFFAGAVLLLGTAMVRLHQSSVPWWFLLCMFAALAFGPSLFTARGRDRLLLQWVAEHLLEEQGEADLAAPSGRKEKESI